MSLLTYFADGSRVVIAVPNHVRDRLHRTCLRGTHCKNAGNFRHWNCLDDVFAHRDTVPQLLEHAQEVADRDSICGSHSGLRASLVFTEDIGWESTCPVGNVDAEALESHYLNGRYHVLRVQPWRSDIRAPRTREVTVAYELRHDPLAWSIVIHTMYPGVDMGRLREGMCEATDRVFFSWNHPGA